MQHDRAGGKHRRYVTQADVARRAGVSRSLASLVLRGSDHVSNDKRERVLQAADELGYLGNHVATSLAGNRDNLLIGFLAQSLSNQLMVEVYENLAAELRAQGHGVVIMEGGYDQSQEDHHLRELVRLRPDGLVVVGYAGSTGALRAAIHSLPVVAVTRQIDLPGVVSVGSDDHLSAELAVDYLVSTGRTDIVHFSLPSDIPYEGRADGFRAAMTKRGLTPRVVEPEFSVEGARRATDELLAAGAPQAMFCGNDQLALGVLASLAAHGISVPDEVAVVGHDNTPVAQHVGLTSIDQHAATQGRRAADAVVAMVDGKTPVIEPLTPEIRVRRTA